MFAIATRARELCSYYGALGYGFAQVSSHTHQRSRNDARLRYALQANIKKETNVYNEMDLTLQSERKERWWICLTVIFIASCPEVTSS